MDKRTANYAPLKGRGAISSPAGRFAATEVVTEDCAPEGGAGGPPTTLRRMKIAGIVSRNSSPDVPFDRSVNPYQGCEHGCIYCYARPSHAYLDLSPGLDFETQIFFKPDAAEKLRATFAKPGYRCEPITVGANTDPYQPAERKLRITRSLLEVFLECRHPVSIITKGTLIERDLDLLGELARERLASVAVSIPTLDADLKRSLEPRVPSAPRRLKTIERLSAAGVPVTVMIAPVIPVLTDRELEKIVEKAAGVGATRAAYVLLRLPHELAGLFREWLQTHRPGEAAHVMSRLREARGGRDNDPRFGMRHRGMGAYADMLRQRYRRACRRHGLATNRDGNLRADLFRKPGPGGQLGLEL